MGLGVAEAENQALIRLENSLTATFDANVTAGIGAGTAAQTPRLVLMRAIDATTAAASAATFDGSILKTKLRPPLAAEKPVAHP